MERFAVEVVLFEGGDFQLRDDCDLDFYQDVDFRIVEVFIPSETEGDEVEKEITAELIRMGML